MKNAAHHVNVHPRKDDHGRTVEIKKPHQPSTPESWKQSATLAVVTPSGEMPADINGVCVMTWNSAPESSDAWEKLANNHRIDEPAFEVPVGYAHAAGAVVLESDGRIWVVAPSNAFAGYQATFPKGTVDPDMSLQATALKESWEESGLQIRLVRHLIDVRRSQSYTRYYLATRVGGNPAAMGWETQAVMLVPRDRIAMVVTHPNDVPILEVMDRLGVQTHAGFDSDLRKDAQSP